MHAERCGWLKHKKLNKRVFVVMSRGRVVWLRGPRDAEERGVVMLEEASVRAEPADKLAFTLYLPTNAAATYHVLVLSSSLLIMVI